MGSRTLGVVLVVALVAMAPLTAAQTFTVTLDTQDDIGTVSPGDSASATVDVRLEGDQFTCAEDEDLPVQIEVSGASGVTASADPAEIIFSDTTGIHNTATPAGGYNETEQTTITLDIASSASSGDRQVSVTGTFPGGNYAPPEGSCDAEFPSAEDSTSLPLTVQGNDTDAGGNAGDGSDGDGGGNGDGGDGEDDNGIPFGSWVVPLALIVTAVMLRRR